jgi:glutamate dehydrogenase
VAGLARVLDATTRWLLASERAGSDSVDETRAGLAVLRGQFAQFVAGEDRALFLERLGELQDLGVDRTLGERIITLRFLPQLLEVHSTARAAGTDPVATARAFYAVSERLGTARLREALREAAGGGAWERRHAQTLSDDVAAAQRRIVAAVLARGGDAGRALAALEAERATELRAYARRLRAGGEDAVGGRGAHPGPHPARLGSPPSPRYNCGVG